MGANLCELVVVVIIVICREHCCRSRRWNTKLAKFVVTQLICITSPSIGFCGARTERRRGLAKGGEIVVVLVLVGHMPQRFLACALTDPCAH